MKLVNLILLVSLLFFFEITAACAADIIINGADSVWSPDLMTASEEVTNATSTSAIFSEAIISGADSVWTNDPTIPSQDALDAIDAAQKFTEAIVTGADSVWSPALQSFIDDVPQDSCSNNQTDPGEADIDCGGVCATKCGDGKTCGINTDCQSGKCEREVCATQSENCTLELTKGDKQLGDEVHIDTIFNVAIKNYAGTPTKVKFLSDECQDGQVDPAANWTDDFEWGNPGDTSWGWHWDADKKIMNWSFGTIGKKEIWAEISEDGKNPQRCKANIQAINVPVLLVHGIEIKILAQMGGGIWPYDQRIDFISMANMLTGKKITDVNQFENLNTDNHIWWKLNRLEDSNDSRTVYLSNYASTEVYNQNRDNGTTLDLRIYANNLAQEILRIKELEDTDKIDIVAHSMGGIVARSYIEGSKLDFGSGDLYEYTDIVTEYRNDVRKLVEIGSPNQGTSFGNLGGFSDLAGSIFDNIGCAAKCMCFWNEECLVKCDQCIADALYGNPERIMSNAAILQLIPGGDYMIRLNSGNSDFSSPKYYTIGGNVRVLGVNTNSDSFISIKRLKLENVPMYLYPLGHVSLIDPNRENADWKKEENSDLFTQLKDMLDDGSPKVDHKTGYAIIAESNVGMFDDLDGIGKLSMKNNAIDAYRSLHNLGFTDDKIYYLAGTSRDVYKNGGSVVDCVPDSDCEPSTSNFEAFFEEIKNSEEIKSGGEPLVIFLIGEGGPGKFIFRKASIMTNWVEDSLSFAKLSSMLSELPDNVPQVVAIDSPYSGSFISGNNYSEDHRVSISSVHDNDGSYSITKDFGYFFFSGLNKGFNIKDAFIEAGDDNAWLDDKGGGSAVAFNGFNRSNSEGDYAKEVWLGNWKSAQNILKLGTRLELEVGSPVELRIRDSQGRVTGLVNGVVKNEVPESYYDSGNESIKVFDSDDIYIYEMVGTSNGTYHFVVSYNDEDGNEVSFSAEAIKTTIGEVHDYQVNWDELTKGEDGVEVKIDKNGDGVFERTYYSGSIFEMPNEAPSSSAGGPYEGNEGDTITLDASGSKAESGQIVKYEWDLDYDGVYETEAATSTMEYVWKDDFSGTIGLLVTQDSGLNATSTDNISTATSTAEVVIENVAPVVDAGIGQTVECGDGETIFSGGFTDPGVLDAHTNRWDFGDGTSAEGTAAPSHKYLAKGSYTATLTVTDDDGGVGSDTVNITVNDTVAPNVVISSPEAKTYLNTAGLLPITYTANDSCDANPQVKVYLDGAEYAKAIIDLGKYLGETEHSLKVAATDASGNTSEKTVPFKNAPQSLKSFAVKDLKIKWQLPKKKGQNPAFTLSGKFELPNGYKKASMDKSALLSLAFDSAITKEKLNFKETGNNWLYQNSGNLNQGMIIKNAVISWMPDTDYCVGKKPCLTELKGKNWFYIRGELTNGLDINSAVKNAVVFLELPLAAYGQKGSIIGKETEKIGKSSLYWRYGSPAKWNYWPDSWWNKWDKFDIDGKPSATGNTVQIGTSVQR